MRNFNWRKTALLLLIMAMCAGEGITAQAAKDTKKPKITYSLDKEEPTNENVTITVTVKDSSKISSVKWAEGEQKKSYFKSDGNTLKLKKSQASITVEKNGVYTFYAKDKAGNAKIKRVTIANIDKTAPVLYVSHDVMEQTATVSIVSQDTGLGIQGLKYAKGNLDINAEEWGAEAAVSIDGGQFKVKESGTYTILAEDLAGNKTVVPVEIQMEFRAVWISYLEFSKEGYTEEEFKAYINEMYDNCVAKNMNAVVVQVRPCSDALYPSKYFPWSVYVSGEQGKNPGYDPLEYMVEAAHARGLEFHAWLNPYRVTLTGNSVSALAENNPARLWRENKETERNVLTFGGKLYYNPSSSAVQELIINGVREIVQNYDVDGIHFDDYFYPTLGSSYETAFDAAEYKAYAAECEEAGKEPKTIVEWRRSNVSNLVKRVYNAIKKIDSECVFGISPAGNISNLYLNDRYYSDVKLWMSSDEYIDYICPQIYWSFEHKSAAYDKMLKQWIDVKTSDSVNLYVGLAAYRAGISEKEAAAITDPEWAESKTVLKRQVEAGRDSGVVDGFILFRYAQVVGSKAEKEMKNLVTILD